MGLNVHVLLYSQPARKTDNVSWSIIKERTCWVSQETMKSTQPDGSIPTTRHCTLWYAKVGIDNCVTDALWRMGMTAVIWRWSAGPLTVVPSFRTRKQIVDSLLRWIFGTAVLLNWRIHVSGCLFSEPGLKSSLLLSEKPISSNSPFYYHLSYCCQAFLLAVQIKFRD